MPRIKTEDALVALRNTITENVEDAANGNSLVSRKEARNLEPFVKRAEAQLRAEGGKGARIRTGDLIERATQEAKAGWNQFNPESNKRDYVWLSKTETKQIRTNDPELGKLTDQAILRMGRSPTPAPTRNIETLVKQHFSSVDFNTQRIDETLQDGSRVDARVGKPGRAGVPQGTLDVFDFYYQAEAQDWASVRLYQGKIDGEPVHVVYMTTDGDDQYLEVFNKNGQAIASSEFMAWQSVDWDEWPGRARLARTFSYDARHEDGYSQQAEAIAAGQIPPGGHWNADVVIDNARVYHQGGQPVRYDLPSTLTEDQRNVATAAINIIWNSVLRHNSHSNPVVISPNTKGTLAIGEFTRSDDGQTYVVADWRDIDDASSTFYYKIGPAAPKLAINQYNN